MAAINQKTWLRYDVPGRIIYHARLPLVHDEGQTFAVLTPDDDVFCEELALSNPDLADVQHEVIPGVVPAPVVGRTYDFAGLTAAQVAVAQGRAMVEVNSARALRGLGPLPAPGGPAGAAAVAAAPVGAGGGLALAAVPGAAALPGAGAAPAPPVPGGPNDVVWVAAEERAGFRYGDEVPAVPGGGIMGQRQIFVTAGGLEIFVTSLRRSQLEQFRSLPATWDLRTLPIARNALGRPERSLIDVVSLCAEEPVDWVVPGEVRTTPWCLNYLIQEGLGLEGHHERFRQITHSDSSSWGMGEHFQTSLVLKGILQIDQLDAMNLYSAELLFRKLQTIEYSYLDKLREIEGRNQPGGRLSTEEQSFFGGMTRQYDTLMVCPSLVDHVRKQVEQEAVMNKNLRKNREELAAMRKAMAKTKGRGKKNGQTAEPENP